MPTEKKVLISRLARDRLCRVEAALTTWYDSSWVLSSNGQGSPLWAGCPLRCEEKGIRSGVSRAGHRAGRKGCRESQTATQIKEKSPVETVRSTVRWYPAESLFYRGRGTRTSTTTKADHLSSALWPIRSQSAIPNPESQIVFLCLLSLGLR